MNLLISMAIWWVPVLALLAFLGWKSGTGVGWGWVLAAIAAFALYSFVVFYAPSIPGFPDIEGAQYNWTGKIAAIFTTFAMMAIALRSSSWVTKETLGLTLKQNDGSLKPALLATAAMVGFVSFLQIVFAQDGSVTDPETLAYQAIIPGVDEELIFRGLLLALLAGALQTHEKSWKWAGIVVTVLFAFGHSFFITDSGTQFDPIALFYVTVLGGLMMFIRLRTGSILIPILAHNLTNVVNKLV